MSELQGESGGFRLDIAAETVEVPERIRTYFRALMLETFRSFPDETVAWLADRLGRENLQVAVGGVRGQELYAPQWAEVLTGESTTSTTFVDLTTPGPSLTGLPDGTYQVLWGATAKTSVAGSSAFVGVQVNSTDPNASHLAQNNNANFATAVRSRQFTLATGGNNTLKLMYASSSGAATAEFFFRWIMAIRVSN